ncbi:hypothetical protein BKA80DRAFT_299429 [Phyllosticta citrichinensis]
MPRATASSSRPQPKVEQLPGRSSRGHQTASPRRSARLRNSTSSNSPKTPIAPFRDQKTSEARPLDPSTAQNTGRKRKQIEDAEHDAENSSSPPSSQQAEQRVECPSPPPSERGTAQKRKRFEVDDASPSAHGQKLETRRSPTPVPTTTDAPRCTSPDPQQDELEQSDPVDYWRKHLVWPSSFFESDGPAKMSNVSRSSSTRKNDRRNSSKEIWNLDISDPGSDSPETRARLLKDDKVQMFFIKHSRAPVGGLPDEAEKLVQQLKTQEQSVPFFSDERVLELVGRKTKGKNEAKVVQDVGPFVVPHVDHLNYLDYNSLEHLTESVDDVWSHCIPILASNCPKPDYTAGFYWSRFNDQQLGAIVRLGPNRECSFSRGSEEQYFPFFTCEAKGTSGDISEARNQSLETALIASRGLIELFRRASLEDKLQRQILCFSAVYDNTTVEIYAHLAHDVREKCPTFYRHQVASFNFPSDRWASYKLIKNMYKIWAPMHGDLICEALDALAKMPGSMAPPSEPTDRSGRSRSRKDLTSDTSPNPHTKKPKTSG